MMKRKLLCSLIVSLSSLAFADGEPKIEKAVTKNGVFITYTGVMTTVIELKDGQFRYWFESDEKSSNEPVYPLTGKYSVDGEVIHLEHDQVFQKKWTFRKMDSTITLWRDDVLKAEAEGTPFTKFYLLGFDNFRRCGAGSILVETQRPAEKAWTERLIPIVPAREGKQVEKK